MPLVKSEIFVEVVEIYPNQHLLLSPKLQENGTCHISLTVGAISMDIKNIRYQIRKNGAIWVGLPINTYRNPEGAEKKKITVPSISFSDPLIFEIIKKAIIKDLEEENSKNAISISS